MARPGSELLALVCCLALAFHCASAANCKLRIVGQGADALIIGQGQLKVALDCQSEPGEAPLLVGYNNTLLSSAAGLRGVHATPDTPCQQDARVSTFWRKPTYPLLTFCGHKGGAPTVVFSGVSISGVGLSRGTRHWRSCVLAFGGGIQATMVDSSINDNQGSSVLRVLNGSSLTMVNVNAARNLGTVGAVVHATRSRLVVRNSNFSGNSVSERGGAIAGVSRTTVSIANTALVGNVAVQAGGAVAGLWSSTINIQDSQLLHNNASAGGALFMSSALSQASVRNCTIAFNQARSLDDVVDEFNSAVDAGVGAGVFLGRGARLWMWASMIYNNTAFLDGGGLAVVDNITDPHSKAGASRAALSDTLIHNNTAYRIGGGAFVRRSYLWDWRGHIAFNRALIGGGLGNNNAISITLVETFIGANSAVQGGGVSAAPADTVERPLAWGSQTVDAGKTVFTNNTAVDGGVDVYAGGAFVIRLENSTITPFNKKSVQWFKASDCLLGEYVTDDTQTCQRCPSYTYILPNTGHTNCSFCDPLITFCPGGAVIVARTGQWHGASQHLCRDQPRLQCNFTLADVTRCPNPRACSHDAQALVKTHPYYTDNTTMMPFLPDDVDRQPVWLAYSNSMCTDASAGAYKGLLCASCNYPYFGQTAPAVCKACLGANQANKQRPDRATISGYWVAYWLLLSLWVAITAASSLPASGGASQHAAQGSLQRMRLIHIIKAVDVYRQYAVLIIAIPVTYLPEPLSKALSTNDGPSGIAGHAWALFAGWSASLDCLMASWDSPALDDGVTRVGIKVLVNALVSTVVLYVAALLLQAIWFLTRGSLEKWAHAVVSSVGRVCTACYRAACCSWRRASGATATITPHAPKASSMPQLCHQVLMARFVQGGAAAERAGTVASNTSQTRGGEGSFAEGAPGAAGSSPAVGSTGPATTPSALSRAPSTAIRSTFKEYMVNRLLLTLLVTIFQRWTVIVGSSISVFFCMEVGAFKYWAADMTTQCPKWSSWPQALGLTITLLWVLFPVAVAVWCRWEVNTALAATPGGGTPLDWAAVPAWRLDAARFKVSGYEVGFDARACDLQWRTVCAQHSDFADAWAAYVWAHTVFWWDMLLDYQRAFLVILANFVIYHEFHQVLSVNAALVAYLLAVAWVQPYRVRGLQRLQVCLLCVLVATTTAMLSCVVPAGFNGTTDAFQHFQRNMSWAAFSLNVAFLLLMLGLAVKAVWGPAQEQWQKFARAMIVRRQVRQHAQRC